MKKPVPSPNAILGKMAGEPPKNSGEIAQILKDHNLVPEADLAETLIASSKSLTLPCYKNNESLIIKILLSKDGSWRQRFLNELKFYKAYQKDIGNLTPKVFKVSSEEPFPFIIIERMAGKALATSRVPERAESDWAPRLAQTIGQVQKLPLPPDGGSNLPHYDGEFTIKKVLSHQKLGLVPQLLFDEILATLEDSKGVLSNACRDLVHGDFLFQNVIETGDNFRLIDWEFVGMGNEAYDAATLWVSTFRIPGWRKVFIEKCLEMTADPKLFEELFTLNLLRLHLREVKMWREVTGEPELAKLVIENCQKELHQALRGFEVLLDDE